MGAGGSVGASPMLSVEAGIVVEPEQSVPPGFAAARNAQEPSTHISELIGSRSERLNPRALLDPTSKAAASLTRSGPVQ